MKRSEMEEALASQMIAAGVTPPVARDAAALQVGILDGHLSWEPEAPEWPELVRGGMASLEYGQYQGCLLVVGADGSRRPVEREVGDRIARAWKARRPGGEMERRLRVLAARQNELNSGVRDEIEATLGLGVEE